MSSGLASAIRVHDSIEAIGRAAWDACAGPDNPFVRYDFIKFDDFTVGAGAEDTVHEITVGTNYYIRGHDLKFTVDVMWLPNGSPVSDSGSGVLASEDTQFVFRSQFQLLL